MEKTDIIIAGAGLAGLSLAVGMAQRPYFDRYRILLIDRENKTQNDRTWCFWATDQEQIPPVVFKTWSHADFFAQDQQHIPLQMAPYRYHMVRGADFYRWAKAQLAEKPNFQWFQADITHIDPENGVVYTPSGSRQGTWVFNSALRGQIDQPNPSQHYSQLLQHFKGWIIRTTTPKFNPEAITFMDYRIDQAGETRFVYVLPFSETEALVEFTIFSKSLCAASMYDEVLRQYLKDWLNIETFALVDTEFGVIPMTDIPMPSQTGNVIHIGTAGGYVKGSSGYAFKRTQRKISAFLADWEENGRPCPTIGKSAWRFRFYDSVMLRVLRENRVPGATFFTQLFEKLPAPLVFRFLDEDTTFADDLHLLTAPPTWPFFKTAMLQLPVLSKL